MSTKLKFKVRKYDTFFLYRQGSRKTVVERVYKSEEEFEIDENRWEEHKSQACRVIAAKGSKIPEGSKTPDEVEKGKEKDNDPNGSNDSGSDASTEGSKTPDEKKSDIANRADAIQQLRKGRPAPAQK